MRRRRLQRHFERRPLRETLAPPVRPDQPAVALAAPPPLRQALDQDWLAAARDMPVAALARLQSRADGLDAAEAARRLARDGPNEIPHEPPLPAWLHLGRCCLNLFNVLLTVLALLSFFSADARATVVIAAMVSLSTVIRFVQKGRSHWAAERLRAMVRNTATVIRRVPGAPVAPVALAATATSGADASTAAPPAKGQEIALRDLVAGDIVLLSAGDMIPVDGIVLSARDRFVAQSAMTGESLPVEKFAQSAAPGAAASNGLLDGRNLVFVGTNAVSGTATARAQLFRHPGGARQRHRDPPQRVPGGCQQRQLAADPLRGGDGAHCLLRHWVYQGRLVAGLLVCAVGGRRPDARDAADDRHQHAGPGAVLLSRKKVVVKRWDAIQNFGALDILCADKTGTLTQDKIALARHADAYGQDNDQVLNFAFLNGHYPTGLKNLLDRAVLDPVELPAERKLKDAYRKVDEIPFDFERRRMSVVVATLLAGQGQHHELV